MADAPARDLLLHDPLSEVTRKERRMLLGTCLLGVGLVKTGLVPTKIAALGVEFDKANQQALLFLLAVVAVYFLLAFVIYAAADFLAWRRALFQHELQKRRDYVARLKESTSPPSADLNLHDDDVWRNFPPRSNYVVFMFAGPVSIVRALFEFLLPVLVGAYAVYILAIAAGRI
jgi:hypothetical protein